MSEPMLRGRNLESFSTAQPNGGRSRSHIAVDNGEIKVAGPFRHGALPSGNQTCGQREFFVDAARCVQGQ